MGTLLSICHAALQQIGQFNVPTSIYGNADPTAVQLLALANLSGQQLTKRYKWQALIETHTFPTANGTETYALPSDYQKFSNITFWNRSAYERMEGPVSNSMWELLKSGNLAAVGGVQYFRVAANLFGIYPTPTAIETIAYQYYSREWIEGQTEFGDDSDEPKLDTDLMALDVRWRFLSAKGLSWESERADFEDALAVARADDGGKDAIRLSAPPTYPLNIPEGNWG